MSLFFLLSIFFLTFLTASSGGNQTIPPPVPPTLVTRLFHHNSIHSPYFEPNMSKKYLADFDFKSSIYRAFYLIGNTSNFLTLTNIELELNPTKRGGFFAEIQIGSGRIFQSVYIDTGSSLLWVNCAGNGFNPYVPEPLFDPYKSSTFKFDKCDKSGICEKAGVVSISCSNNRCRFEVAYGDGSYAEGAVAREQFVFDTEVVQEIFFGCAYKINNIRVANGVLGLGNDRTSFIAQRGYTKFAYCIGNLSDMSYEYNKLMIGNLVDLTGVRTSMILENKYFINLDHIEIGDITLNIDRKMLKRDGYNGGMLVDTGSTYTFMPKVAVETFEAIVINVITNKVEKNFTRNEFFPYNGYARWCYNGDVKGDMQSFGNVRLIFEGGATMELPPENVFHQVSEECFCLGVLPMDLVSEGATISILGTLMQQNFYVAFDMDSKQVSFQDADCALFDD